MAILAHLRQSRLQADKPATDDFWYNPVMGGAASLAGMAVSPDTALRVTTVYACVRILAETIAQLPLHLYRRTEDGKEKATDHPLYHTLRRHPNPWQGSYSWRETLQGHVALRGNAYSIIRPGPRGAVDALIPVRPDRVRVEQLDSLRLRFWIRGKDGIEKPYTQDEVFRVPGLSDDGITGLSPISMAREAVGLAMAAEAFGARFFNNDARPGGVLSTDKALTAEQRVAVQRSWNDAHQGSVNSHKVAVLEGGLSWSQVGLNSDDAQFLETRKFQRVEIAGLFHVPPHMVGDLERATFTNIEQQSIEFVVFTMLPWIKRWEEAISRDLLPEEDQEEYFPEFDVRGLLRGDSAMRSAYYRDLFNIGVLSQNDIRRLENENPIDGGDRYFVPLNMVPSDRLDETLDEPEPVPAPPRDDARRAFGVLVEDCAERIARAEIRELEKRADRAVEDRPRFDAWVEGFYADHGGYVLKTLAPLAGAWALQSQRAVDTAGLVALIVQAGKDGLTGEDIPLVLESWRQTRARDIFTLIEGVLHG